MKRPPLVPNAPVETWGHVLRIVDVASLTGLSSNTIRSAVRKGALPSIRLGPVGPDGQPRGAIRIPAAAIRALIGSPFSDGPDPYGLALLKQAGAVAVPDDAVVDDDDD